MQAVSLRNAFDSGDGFSGGGGKPNCAGANELAIDEDGAGATMPLAAAVLGTS
jgi:hypothetical protein